MIGAILAMALSLFSFKVDAACTTGPAPLYLQIPTLGDAGNLWANCIRQDLITISSNVVTSTSTTSQATFGHIWVNQISGLNNGIFLSSTTVFSSSVTLKSTSRFESNIEVASGTVNIENYTSNPALHVMGSGANGNQMWLDAPSGQFTEMDLRNAGVQKAVFYYDNTANKTHLYGVTGQLTLNETGGGVEIASGPFSLTGTNAYVRGNFGIGAVPSSTLTVAGITFINNSLNPNIVMNSAGANYGMVSNVGTGQWSLGYGPNIGTPVTNAIQWDSNARVVINGTQVNNSYRLNIQSAVTDGGMVSFSTGAAAGQETGVISWGISDSTSLDLFARTGHSLGLGHSNGIDVILQKNVTTGSALCLNSSKILSVCSSVVGAGGTCTCN